MQQSELAAEINRRRTFAIISHPDAGKTTLTEKLLLFGGAINNAGDFYLTWSVDGGSSAFVYGTRNDNTSQDGIHIEISGHSFLPEELEMLYEPALIGKVCRTKHEQEFAYLLLEYDDQCD